VQQVQVQEEEEAQAPAPAKRGRKPAAKEPVAKEEPKAKTAARSKNTKKAVQVGDEPEPMTIPETQPDPMDIEDSIEVEEIPESMPPPPRPSARRTQAQPSRARQPSAGARRAGSASDSERDPVLRRKLGDLTRKLESMTVKYETLKDAASAGKESNFEQLKKRTEQTAKGTFHFTSWKASANIPPRPRRRHPSPKIPSLRPHKPHIRPPIHEEGTRRPIQRKRPPDLRNQETHRLALNRTKRVQDALQQTRRRALVRAARAEERARKRHEAPVQWRRTTRYRGGCEGSCASETESRFVQ
jgi:hypothetical protein